MINKIKQANACAPIITNNSIRIDTENVIGSNGLPIVTIKSGCTFSNKKYNAIKTIFKPTIDNKCANFLASFLNLSSNFNTIQINDRQGSKYHNNK